MSEQQTERLTILFADVAGSTHLYEKIGDSAAQLKISRCLEFLTAIVHKHQGTIVKHIGDEILCRFHTALEATTATCEIQLQMRENREMASSGLRIRCGMNTGPVIMAENDVFGDTVNVAARMAGLAQAAQIICSGDTIKSMGQGHGIAARQLDSLFVKGKGQQVDIYEVLWSPDDTDLTAFFSAKEVLQMSTEWKVNLKCADRFFQINKAHPNIVIGRSNECDFVIPSPHASRKHAKLISRWGKIVFVDQSTNGSYVKLEQGTEFFVHMEEVPLSENGFISLGVPSGQNEKDVIWFNYEHTS